MGDLGSVEFERWDELTLVRIVGEVDISNARELLAAIEAGAPEETSTLAVDLTGTTYLDSAGIQLLFLLAERLDGRRRRLRLIVPEGAPIRAVLELTGLPKLVPLEDRLDRDQAIADRADG